MIRLIYVSSATPKMKEEDLVNILTSAHKNNKARNVTGMLLYAGGNFFQVLEGEEDDVRNLYEKIKLDERHSNCIVIEEEPIDSRTFPDWSMGFKHLKSDDIAKLPGYSEILQRHKEPEEFANQRDSVVELIYLFKRQNMAG